MSITKEITAPAPISDKSSDLINSLIDWWPLYLGALGLAFTFALLLTPLCKKLAWKIDLLDKPRSESHKLHDKATPLLGGLAVTLSWLAVLGGGFLLLRSGKFFHGKQLGNLLDFSSEPVKRLVMIIGGAIAFLALGVADDRKAMSAKLKFSLQFIICLLTAIFAVRIDFIQNTPFSLIMTVVWLLGCLNAVNFQDNMDGLCCGLGAIAFFFFGLTGAYQGQYLVTAMSLALSGSCLGFYVYNCNPASIFLGDGGSHIIGYMLGVTGLLVTYGDGSLDQAAFPVIIPLLILAIPLFDLFAVIIIRRRLGKPIYIGDHNHISHRFLHMDYSRRCAVLLVHLLAVFFGCNALAMLGASAEVLFICSIQCIALLSFLTILHSRKNDDKKEKSS